MFEESSDGELMKSYCRSGGGKDTIKVTYGLINTSFQGNNFKFKHGHVAEAA